MQQSHQLVQLRLVRRSERGRKPRRGAPVMPRLEQRLLEQNVGTNLALMLL